jgi:hypothetical protein
MRFFGSVASQKDEEPSPAVRQAVSRYGEVSLRSTSGTLEMKRVILEEMPEQFTFKELAVRLPGYPSGGVRRALSELKEEGRVILTCRGIHARWMKIAGRGV